MNDKEEKLLPVLIEFFKTMCRFTAAVMLLYYVITH